MLDTVKLPSTNTGFSKSNNFTTLSSIAPPSPPASLRYIEIEESACEAHSMHEDWLYKQSSRFKTWNKRWFVLRDNKLFYFKNSKVKDY